MDVIRDQIFHRLSMTKGGFAHLNLACMCCWWSNSIHDSQKKMAPLNWAESPRISAEARSFCRKGVCMCSPYCFACVRVCVYVEYVSWQPRSLSTTDVAVLAASSPNTLLLAHISVILSGTFINEDRLVTHSLQDNVLLYDKCFGLICGLSRKNANYDQF